MSGKVDERDEADPVSAAVEVNWDRPNQLPVDQKISVAKPEIKQNPR
jgi:hypothetical protein